MAHVARAWTVCAGFVSCAVWAAGNGAVGVAATVIGKGHCNFSTKALTLDFGTIDPASVVNATASATLTFDCNGNGNTPITYSVSANDGQNPVGAGARRMRHATVTTEFLAYSISLSPTSGTLPKNTLQVLTVNGAIQPFQFQGVQAGAYTDSVTLTLAP